MRRVITNKWTIVFMLPNLSSLQVCSRANNSEETDDADKSSLDDMSGLVEPLDSLDLLDALPCIGVQAGRTYEQARDERRAQANERQEASRQREVMLRRQMRDRVSDDEVDRMAVESRIQQVDTSGTRPALSKIDSRNPQHLRVLSVMCYTKNWDSIMNKVLTSPVSLYGTAGLPHAILRQEFEDDYFPPRMSVFPFFMTSATKEKFRRYLLSKSIFSDPISSKYAVFDEFSEGDPPNRQLAFVMNKPTEYCATFPKGRLFDVELPERFVLSESPEVPEREDIGDPDDASTVKQVVKMRVDEVLKRIERVPMPEYALAYEIFDEAVYNMIETIKTCFYPVRDILNFECQANERLGPNASGKYVRFRGQHSTNGGNVMVPERLNSTTHSPSVAESFTYRKDDPNLHVLLLSRDCPVLDIRTFLGADQNPELVCFSEECEVLLKPDLRYKKLSLADAMVYGAQDMDYFISSEIYGFKDENNTPIKVSHWFVEPKV